MRLHPSVTLSCFQPQRLTASGGILCFCHQHQPLLASHRICAPVLTASVIMKLNNGGKLDMVCKSIKCDSDAGFPLEIKVGVGQVITVSSVSLKRPPNKRR